MQSIVAESNEVVELRMGPYGCRKPLRIMSDGSVLKQLPNGNWEHWSYICRGDSFRRFIENRMDHRIFVIHNEDILDSIPRKK